MEKEKPCGIKDGPTLESKRGMFCTDDLPVALRSRQCGQAKAEHPMFESVQCDTPAARVEFPVYTICKLLYNL